MGNKQSHPPNVCASPVSATPTVAKLSERDVANLNKLYGHDDELLQLMYAAELLRDCAKCVRDDARAYFHHAQHACDKQREFGARLRTLSEKAERNTKGIIHVPSGNGATPSQSPRPVPPDAAAVAASPPSATALEQPFLEDDDSVHPLDLSQPGVTEPLLEEVLGTTRMVSKLANAQMDGAERYANFVAMFMHKLDEMARKVEKAHSMKLERHAPYVVPANHLPFSLFDVHRRSLPSLISVGTVSGPHLTSYYAPTSIASSALAHEKAYNHLAAPEHRLRHLMHLPDAKRSDDVEKRIDMAEVDLEKRRAQLDATSRMLKRRAKVFLNKFTPHVTDAVRAFTVCQHQARMDTAGLLEDVIAEDPVERLRTVEPLRERCAWFIDTEDSDCPYVAQDASVSSPEVTPPGSGGEAVNGGAGSRALSDGQLRVGAREAERSIAA
jgi:dimethylaniline monooxygenase (N-oxide forming)